MRAVVIGSGVTLLLLLIIMMPALQNAATAYLFFTPGKGAEVSTGKLAVNGTSAPSNSTRTKCTVEFRTDANAYSPVTPMGKGIANYTVWKSDGVTIHRGVNVLEGRFQCFSPALPSFPSLPVFTHFLTHNVTAA